VFLPHAYIQYEPIHQFELPFPFEVASEGNQIKLHEGVVLIGSELSQLLRSLFVFIEYFLCDLGHLELGNLLIELQILIPYGLPHLSGDLRIQILDYGLQLLLEGALHLLVYIDQGVSGGVQVTAQRFLEDLLL